MNCTGESTAAMNRRIEDRYMADIIAALRDGGVLVRAPRLSDYYVRLASGEWGNGVLRPSRVAALERDGVLRLVGAETYALGEVAVAPPEPEPPAEKASMRIVSVEPGEIEVIVAYGRATATCTAVAVIVANGAPDETVSHRAVVETEWVEDAAGLAMARAVDGAARDATALVEARRAAAA